jgi:hypothetical protein
MYVVLPHPSIQFAGKSYFGYLAYPSAAKAGVFRVAGRHDLSRALPEPFIEKSVSEICHHPTSKSIIPSSKRARFCAAIY